VTDVLSSEAGRLVSERPGGWGYSLFAVLVREGLARSDDEKPAQRLRRSIADPLQALAFLQEALNEEAVVASSIEAIFKTSRMQRAFGRGGDPQVIREVASDVVAVYARLGLLANRLTTADLPARFERLSALIAQTDEGLRRQVLEFSNALASAVARIPELLSMPAAQRPHVQLALVFRMDPVTQDAIASELRFIQGAVKGR